MQSTPQPDTLALQCLYRWESTAPTRIALSQPMGGGKVRDFTWAEVSDQVRRMATYLKAQGWEPGSKVAILSKNCAWWLMSDLAIWMAGYVSVPLYPTLAADTVRQILTHSEARACFVGKLDGWEGMKPGIPAGLPCISYPLSPPDAIRHTTRPAKQAAAKRRDTIVRASPCSQSIIRLYPFAVGSLDLCAAMSSSADEPFDLLEPMG